MPTKTNEEILEKAVTEVATARERLEEVLLKRDRTMQVMHQGGMGYEQIGRIADLSHIGVLRAIKRLAQKESAA
jgi:hypothetical protein